MAGKKREPKPIRVFYSTISERFYASAQYRESAGGIVVITGKKFDVTNEIAAAILAHDLEFLPATTGTAEARP